MGRAIHLPAASGGRCVITPTRQVAPLVVPESATLRVTTTLQVDCIEDRPLHIVLLVDASEAMNGAPLDGARTALIAATRGMVLSSAARIGVVSIGGRPEAGGAQIATYLTADSDRVVSSLRGLTATGPTCLTCGLEDAFIVLRAGRAARDPSELREVIILVSGGADQSGCEAVQSKAREIQAHNVLLVTACAGPACELGCLAEAATPRFAFRTDSWDYVSRLLSDLQSLEGSFHPLQRASFVDQLSAGFAFNGWTPGEPEGNRIDWVVEPWPVGGARFEYAVTAHQCGASVLSARAAVTLTFDEGREDVLAFANPNVNVTCAGPTPTETPVPPATPTPTSTETATATSIAPHVEHAYLPWLGAAGCGAPPPPLDIVFVIDVSGSMAAPYPPYDSRWSAARTLALEAISVMGPADRVASIAYADEAVVLHGLTPDRDMALASVRDRLPRLDGSRLTAGLAAAAQVLAEGRPSAAKASVVVLTDGDLNQAASDDVRAEASRLASEGAALSVVLFDAAADASLWRELAGPTRVHVPTAATWRVLATVGRCR
jgi:Mg-chelatase subunit ChlD